MPRPAAHEHRGRVVRLIARQVDPHHTQVPAGGRLGDDRLRLLRAALTDDRHEKRAVHPRLRGGGGLGHRFEHRPHTQGGESAAPAHPDLDIADVVHRGGGQQVGRDAGNVLRRVDLVEDAPRPAGIAQPSQPVVPGEGAGIGDQVRVRDGGVVRVLLLEQMAEPERGFQVQMQFDLG